MRKSDALKKKKKFKENTNLHAARKNTDVTFLDVLLSVYGLFKIQKVVTLQLFPLLVPAACC